MHGGIQYPFNTCVTGFNNPGVRVELPDLFPNPRQRLAVCELDLVDDDPLAGDDLLFHRIDVLNQIKEALRIYQGDHALIDVMAASKPLQIAQDIPERKRIGHPGGFHNHDIQRTLGEQDKSLQKIAGKATAENLPVVKFFSIVNFLPLILLLFFFHRL